MLLTITVLGCSLFFGRQLLAAGKGDNRDDSHSGKVDRVGDGNSGQGDDLHKPQNAGSTQVDVKNNTTKGPGSNSSRSVKETGKGVDNGKNHAPHHGNLPPGLKKKYDRGDALPPSWQKRVDDGEIDPTQ